MGRRGLFEPGDLASSPSQPLACTPVLEALRECPYSSPRPSGARAPVAAGWRRGKANKVGAEAGRRVVLT